MMRYNLIQVFCVALLMHLFSYPAHSTVARNGRTPFKLVNSNENGWTFEYVPSPFQSVPVEIDGKQYVTFVSPATSREAGEGFPSLPIDVLSLGIPFTGSLTVDILDPVYDAMGNQLVAPVPGYEYTKEKEAVAIYKKNAGAYASDRFFPSQPMAVEKPFTLRQQRIGTIRISPYQYNPHTKTLRRLQRATLRIRILSAGQSTVGRRPEAELDPRFEDVYKSLVSNYEQAKQWREASRGQGFSSTDPTRDWFETGRTYYRVPIGSDGWYRVMRSDLIAAGADLSQMDLPSIKVFGRGVQVPVIVRPDTTIEFYARQNYGDSSYFDPYNDTSAYWLTWGGASGKQFSAVSQPTGVTSLNVQSSRVTKHFEKNTDYFDGTTQFETTQNGNVPGEGWVWEYSYPFPPYDNLTFPFALDSIDFTGSSMCTLRVRLFSTTPNFNTYDHDAQFRINDSLAGEVFFAGRTGITFTATVPSSWLFNGNNVLKMSSLPTSSSPNSFYLDWFEVDYQRLLRAQSDQVFFTSPTSSESGPAQFTVSGFSSPQIDVFDLTGARMITGGAVSGGGSAGFTITFKDTFSSTRSYVVVSSSGSMPVPPIAAKTFSDIRVNAQGTDYLLISHKNFLSPAQQLGAHRQIVSGVRVKVIDVQDIYDEFNYGMASASSIKNFLRYAYQIWPAPAPAYVLLLGDASWDPHRYMSTSVKTDYVPAYGVPAGDNWYGCFDTTYDFLPSLLIGRIPVFDSTQAQHTIDKIIGYDSYTLGEWNKDFMMISGGTTPFEQISFDASSEALIGSFISPPPIGGTPLRVYKTTPAVIDGEHKQLMKDLVRDGLVFINFLGHSGSRTWGVDIGPPSEFENTNGRLPFISSASCNVGAFAEPSSNVLSEDFVLADNRGAIAISAASSLGYPDLGTALTSYFLSGAVVDSVRDFGSLTTIARYRLWQSSPGDYRVVSTVNCNPLLGDPLSRLAIPKKPDLAISTSDVAASSQALSVNDSSETIRINIHNYGLVPTDSVGILVNDVYDGNTYLVANKKLRSTFHRDSLVVSWDASSQVGRHTLVTTLDPNHQIDEVNELNNAASSDQYVYANLLSVVKPINNMVVPPGPQTLVITSPIGLDSIGFQYFFELDTVDTFDSPFLVASGAIVPGPVSGQWMTPSLAADRVYFWRARTMDGTVLGNWVTAAFSTSSALPPIPLVRIRESTQRQFARDNLTSAASTDSGVTIAPNPATQLNCKSWGNHGVLSDRYAIIKIGETVIFGYWWELGAYSFMAVRFNDIDGSYVLKAFDVSGQPAEADSMVRFIRDTPVGNYLAIAVILDGRTNVSESLYVAIESLGSTLIRQVLPGHAWALIGRRGNTGPGMPALESWSPSSVAEVGLQVPRYYSAGSGSVCTRGFSIPTFWDSFHWRRGAVSGVSDVRVALLGTKNTGAVDTLRMLPVDSTDVSMAFMNALTSGPTYTSFKSAALLSSGDPLVTPVLRDWWVDVLPPADLAISSRTVGIPNLVVQKGNTLNLPVTVYNIGFQGADSARITVSVYDKFNRARPIAWAQLDSIPVGGTNSTTIPIATTNFSRRVILQVAVAPSKKSKDLVAENNVAYFALDAVGNTAAPVQVFADGVQIMDGDYVAARPKLIVHLPTLNDERGKQQARFFVDGRLIEGYFSTSDELEVTPDLTTGHHDFKVQVSQVNSLGEVDSIEHVVTVNVVNESRILQLYNYPNPFAQETYFTFVLTGARPPEELAIRIFTITGRKIREITAPQSGLQVGFNRVYWNGRDADGDEVANGYYFYQVTIKGEGKTDSAIEKLVKMR